MPVHGKDGNGLFGKRSLEFGHHAPTGHRISAQGANLGNPPGRRDPRYEGTPHILRVSDIDPGLSYAVFLQNTLILWDAVPRAMPWAGMRCPLRAYQTITVSIPDGRPRFRYCGPLPHVRYCAPSAPLTDGVGSVLDREVD